jgi:hypothetical protein
VRAVLVAAAIALTACVTVQQSDPQQEAFDQHLAVIGAQLDAGMITRKQAAASARDKARQVFSDPYMDELWAYRVMLADQVERGQTTVNQAAYLDERKVNEIMERLRTSAPQQRALFRPTVTCRPDGYGGVRCR